MHSLSFKRNGRVKRASSLQSSAHCRSNDVLSSRAFWLLNEAVHGCRSAHLQCRSWLANGLVNSHRTEIIAILLESMRELEQFEDTQHTCILWWSENLPYLRIERSHYSSQTGSSDYCCSLSRCNGSLEIVVLVFLWYSFGFFWFCLLLDTARNLEISLPVGIIDGHEL